MGTRFRPVRFGSLLTFGDGTYRIVRPVRRASRLGIGVAIQYAGGGKGALTLKFASLDQLDMICQRLSGESI